MKLFGSSGKRSKKDGGHAAPRLDGAEAAPLSKGKYFLRNMLLIPLGIATVVYLMPVLITTVMYEVFDLNMYVLNLMVETYGYTVEANFLYWAIFTIAYGATSYALFLRMFGAAFSPGIFIDVAWISENAVDVYVDIIVNGVYLVFIPLLSIFLARCILRRFYDERDSLTVAVSASVWLALIGVACAMAAQYRGFRLTDGEFVTTGVSYPILSAAGMTFAVSLFIQLLFAYRGKRAPGEVVKIGEAAQSGENLSEKSGVNMLNTAIFYGLKPVRWLLYITPVVLAVWLVLMQIIPYGGASGLNEIFSFLGDSTYALLAVLVCVLGLLLWVACFIFGMPLMLLYDMPMDGVSETIMVSMFGITAGSERSALPLVTVISVIISAVLVLIIFGSIRARYNDRHYWISGGIALAVHIAFLLLIARFSAYSIHFNPSADVAHALRLMSGEPDTLFLGMRMTPYWMVGVSGAAYALFGFLGEKDAWPSKLSAALDKLKTQIIPGGAVLLALAVYMSVGTMTEAVNANFAEKPYEFTDLFNMLMYYVGDLGFLVENAR